VIDPDKINEALGDAYAIEREIGSGGMATVYLARDVKHDRDVALKVLRPELGATLGADRFLAEIKLTAALQHPNILPLFDSGSAGDLLYYVMPYVRGETLRYRLDRDGSLPVDEAVAIAQGIAAALDHAHRQGVVHRDVKPENVLLSDGVPIVADFGIARAVTAANTTRATAAGVSLGTPAYMSPEQATAEQDVDRRADLYSLGCVLFEMLTGEAPFKGETARAVIVQHLTAPVPSAHSLRDTVPVPVDDAIRRALAKDREERFETASEMSAALVTVPPVEPLPDYSQVTEPVTRSTTPLAGRKKEFAALVTKLNALAEGRGGMVLVSGEPGVGKTKLTEALLLEARARGYVCNVGHCYEMEGAPAYLPFVEILDYATRTVPPGRLRAVLGDAAPEFARFMPRLRQLYPDIGEPLDLPPDQQRHYLFTQFVGFYERATRSVPIVLHFDDLHWADESTLLLLEHLAVHLPRLRVLVIGTYRDVDLEVARPFAKSLERLTRNRLADRIALRRMDTSDIAALLTQLGGSNPPKALVRAIYSETEGNPFFVEEVFRHLRDEGRLLDAEGRWLPDLSLDTLDVPEGVKLVIGRRLERVGEACQAVLTSAAVIGPRFELTLLEEVSGITGDELLDALEEAEHAKLILSQQIKRETVYTFEHELVRQTLLAALSVPRRLRRHLKTAQAIEALHPGREDRHASALAYHYFQSGSTDEEKTTRYLLMAGQQALDAGAFDEALAHADKAFTVIEDSGPRRRADLVLVRASALRGLGRWEDATRAYDEALELLGSLDAPADVLSVTRMLAEMIYYLATEHARGLEIVDRTLRNAPNVASADRVRLLSAGAALRGLNADFDAGKEMSDRAADMAREVGGAEVLGIVLTDRSALFFNAGYVTESLACAREAVALLEGTSRRWSLVWANARILNGVRLLGRPRDTLALAEALLPETEAVGHVGAKMVCFIGRTGAEMVLSGRVDLLEAGAEEVEHDYRDFGTWREIGPVWRAVAAMDRGETDVAGSLEGSGERLGNDSWLDVWWTVEFMAAASDHPTKARAILEANKHRIPVAGSYAPIGARVALHPLINGLIDLGDHAAAAALYPACTETLAMGLVGEWWLIDEAAGRAAEAAGDLETAEQHFTEALRIAREGENVFAEANVLLSHGRMLLTHGIDAERGRAMIEEALPMFEAGERTRPAKECRELLGG